jgi:hypothetical protein
MTRSNLCPVLPSSFVARWKLRPKREFLASFGDTLLLLIRIEDPSAGLVIALEAAFSGLGEAVKPSRAGIEFATVTSPRRRREMEATAAAKRAAPSSLEQRLWEAPYFVAPLRKRKGAERPFQERISVGRTQNSDIVLRHPSVSKFHAWFECDGEGDFYVFDAGSKNHTTLNDKRLMARLPNQVRLGDDIRFGEVETTLSSADLFWETIAGSA